MCTSVTCFLLALFPRYTEYLNVLEFNSVLVSPHYGIPIPSNPPFKKILFYCLELRTLSAMLSVGKHISGTYLCTNLPWLPEGEVSSEESEDCHALLLLTFHELTAMVPAIDRISDPLLT